mmetsp:Transcript_27497/g.42662  ORF Transcript_27497/g.42662 Transcript_27497/m.42662 type:complete len:513 (+) Transcript_27497:234-1772(+)|eukprot:CAMPEP_0196812992 /NCGR_PEP_ID=MMETSP1362-20130617/32846_1 /TAXON_ID=163516 /ORGANISM="Leptocylindrus danicus, Strain CCMP1856" /LENGTH=512 /DNA_ID=CAMNT_0042188979 /DNA_START=227 /DNA_END=1765 /DNA_ORIENTATION=-
MTTQFDELSTTSKETSTSTVRSQEDSIEVTKEVKLFAFCAALNSCNLGFDIGVYTGASSLIQDDLGLSDTELEIFIGSINFFAIIGALGSAWFSDQYGRLHTFKMSAYIFNIGILFTIFAQGYWSLMIGRFFIGIGVGTGFAIDPIYIAEISPAVHRGGLVTWSELATNFGIVLGFTSLLAYSPLSDGLQWRVMVGTGGILPLVMIYLSSYVMIESPRWLVAKNRTEEAEQNLTRIYPEGFAVTDVLEEIQESLIEEKRAQQNLGWGVFWNPPPAIKRMLLVGIGAAGAQQIVGIDAIQYYLVQILDDAGIEGDYEQAGWLIFLGVLKFCFIFVAIKVFDTLGRRPLFFISLTGMIIALLVLAFNFYGSKYDSVTLMSLGLYLVMFTIGMGPGSWLIPSEVFSTNIRAKAMSIATVTNRLVATIVSTTTLTAKNTIGFGTYFLILAGCCVLVLLFYIHVVPETKGKHLEEMTHYFAEITNDQSVLELESRVSQIGDPTTPLLSGNGRERTYV